MEFKLIVKAPKNAPVVWNYDELHTSLEMALAEYQNRVYTEDMITEAKEDRAKLNKLKKAISDERVARKKEYMQPFETFENQAKELCELIEQASSGISEQLDIFEEKRIAEKMGTIRTMFDEIISNYDLPFITFEKVFNEKWENKGVSDKAIAKEITDICEKAVADLAVIARLPKYSFEASEAYKETLDLNVALTEGEKMADIALKKRQAALEEAKRQIEGDAEERFEVAFKCRVTRSQAKALSAFCQDNGIIIEKI